ncbi:hypothetical protein CALCODRAFT_514340 [Calocera cornea HHB12733]|uniref:Uncharacterized protein n=1 Tax=Calocera cornea HHB12733 TaxID=1353952 RepID=A0A165JKI5_9BASI|nr:hypothetical protein CALCODRAFT_514340 [Calocera cornea HHB12733]
MTSMMPIEPTYAAMATSPTTGRRFFRRHSDSHYTHPTDVGGAALEATTDHPGNAALEEMLDEFGPEEEGEEEEEGEGWGVIEEARRVWRRMSFGNHEVRPETKGVKPPAKPAVKAASHPAHPASQAQVQAHPEGKGKAIAIAPLVPDPQSAVHETPNLTVSIPK